MATTIAGEYWPQFQNCYVPTYPQPYIAPTTTLTWSWPVDNTDRLDALEKRIAYLEAQVAKLKRRNRRRRSPKTPQE